VKPRVWIDSVPHGERRPRSFIASDLSRCVLSSIGTLGDVVEGVHDERPPAVDVDSE
jgi:hypothetical protein